MNLVVLAMHMVIIFFKLLFPIEVEQSAGCGCSSKTEIQVLRNISAFALPGMQKYLQFVIIITINIISNSMIIIITIILTLIIIIIYYFIQASCLPSWAAVAAVNHPHLMCWHSEPMHQTRSVKST